ncbi:MAG TPA: GvpL/GvpF family gas vesicle protein [Candidatus Limnocylindrales bacterium]|nr:GvpL/GvpF family gas vesicle protein [Candidatus Limnocylindrales bacterium]
MSSLIAHAVSAARPAPDLAGLRGLPLRAVALEDLLLWATAWPDADRALTRADALRHHEIVAKLCLEETCLPIRFGTWIEGEEAARSRLRADGAALRAALARVRGRRELAAGAPTAAPRRGGRAYLEARRAGLAAADARRRSAEEAALRLRDGLSVEQADARHEICPSDRVALSMSLLVPVERAQALKDAAVRVASGLPGVRAVVSGPWPPYTFVVGR